MIFTGIFLLGFAPGLFWLWYFYKQDKWEPEPKSLVLRTFFWGLAAAIVGAIVEIPFGEFRIFSLIVLAPLVEEAVKFGAVRFTIYKHAEFDEPMDGITYAAAAALGFASLENSFYLLGSYGLPFTDFVAQDADDYTGGVLPLFLIRGILSVPAHVLFSSLWGYALGWSKFMNKEYRTLFIVRGYIIAVILHGTFNLLALSSSFGAFLLLVFVVIMWKVVGKRIHLALSGSPHLKKEEG